MSHIVNPDSVGNPEETPIVQADAAMLRWLRACDCGGLNGYHRADCPNLPAGSQKVLPPRDDADQ